MEKLYEWDEEVPDHAPDLYDFSSLAKSIDGLENVNDEALQRFSERCVFNLSMHCLLVSNIKTVR